ncbi:hypothetical protein [Tenacibaculum xiamenense]|uniref:hypothetical protein n=1 Tax=Tenacibaculum xiamenense TaxID=1261553 RepID=UPI003894A9B5
MALENLISVSFSEQELNQFDEHLKGIQAILEKKVVNLTPDQRRQYGRIANQNKLIVNKAKDYMEQYPEWMPSFIDKVEFDKDYKTREQVEGRAQKLENLSRQLIDTKTLLDHDNYTNALSFYRMVRYLAGENQAGAKSVYEDMKVLFQRVSTTDNSDNPTKQE